MGFPCKASSPQHKQEANPTCFEARPPTQPNPTRPDPTRPDPTRPDPTQPNQPSNQATNQAYPHSFPQAAFFFQTPDSGGAGNGVAPPSLGVFLNEMDPPPSQPDRGCSTSTQTPIYWRPPTHQNCLIRVCRSAPPKKVPRDIVWGGFRSHSDFVPTRWLP